MISTLDATAPAEPLTKIAYWIGKCPCKGCRNVIRVEREMRGTKKTRYGYSGRYPYQVTEWHMVGEYPHYSRVTCIAHKREFFWKCVNGKFSEAHICDARCMSAAGPNCECSCGGANHGKSYDLISKFQFNKTNE